MKEKITGFFGKIAPYINKINSNPYLQSISGAMMGTIGIMLIGSISVLMRVLPRNFPAFSFLSVGADIFGKLNSLTIGSMALYVVIMAAYHLVSRMEPDEDSLSAAVIALLQFLVITPLGTTEEGTAIPLTWLGAQGVFSALIVGLVSARIYIEIKRRKWTIKMPEGVPPMVSRIFASLIPLVLITFVFAGITVLFNMTSFGSLNQFIYTMLQQPLQGLGGSIAAVVVVSLVMQILWFFGIHGSNVVMPIVQSLWMAMDAENLAAIASGAVPPNITGHAFFSIMTWSGTSLGLCILMLLAKSQRYRQVGRVGIVPILFGIGEPIVYGTPLVLNFRLAVPLITNNAIVLTLGYFLTKIGIIARCAGVAPVFGLPIGLYAAPQGSISIVLYHLFVCLILGPILWWPWFHSLDMEEYAKETTVMQTASAEE